MKTASPLGALVRLGAGGVHRAPVRAGAAARHRPAAARGSAAAHLRSVSGAAAARADRAAGRHRRHRRGEPQGDRAMAVAAHRGGRSGHPAQRARAPSSSASTSSSPSPTACRPPLPRESFRGLDDGDPRQARQPAEQRRGSGRCDQAGPRRRRPGRLGDAGAALAGRDGAADRLRRQGARSGAVPGDVSRAVAQRSADRAGRRRPRAVLDQSRTRRHRPPRAGGHEGARTYWCLRCRWRCCASSPTPAPSWSAPTKPA